MRSVQRWLLFKLTQELARPQDLDSLERGSSKKSPIPGDDAPRPTGQSASEELDIVPVVAGGRRNRHRLHHTGLAGDEIQDGLDVDRGELTVKAFSDTAVLGQDLHAGYEFEPSLRPGRQDLGSGGPEKKIQDAGIEGASFHTLRHTAAAWMVQDGVSLYEVQHVLGHSTPVMTQRYAHLQPGHLQRAVNAVDKKLKAPRGLESPPVSKK